MLDIKKIIREEIYKKQFAKGKIHFSDRDGMLYKAWGHVFTNHLVGDYVEFGVYNGDSLVKSFRNYVLFRQWLEEQQSSNEAWRREVAKNYIAEKSYFHGLDTFEGIPSNQEENATFQKGTFLAKISEVENHCNENNLRINDQLFLYKGLFSQTACELKKNLVGRKICILNIDSDLYESAKDALKTAAPYLDIGSVLMFDDYNAFSANNEKGERRAFREFQCNNKLLWESWQAYHFSGQSFLCVGKKS
jgi:hypothetical protein